MKVLSIAAVLLLGGCASQPKTQLMPLMDMHTLPEGRSISKDIKECNAYADTQPGVGESAFAWAGTGAAMGAGLGALIGAAMGGDPYTAAMWGAGSGAVHGSLWGAVGAEQNKRWIVCECMRGREYKILRC